MRRPVYPQLRERDITAMLDTGAIAMHVEMPESKATMGAPKTPLFAYYVLAHWFTGVEEWLVNYDQ